jgi:hypothetical protein
MVGTAGIDAERFDIAIASGRSLPTLINGVELLN